MKKVILTMTILVLITISYAQVQQAWVARANGVENKDEFGSQCSFVRQGEWWMLDTIKTNNSILKMN